MRNLVALTCIIYATYAAASQKPFIIVVPSYNNSLWYAQNLDSIRMQDYPHYHVLYIDDCSTDNTAALVDGYVVRHALGHKITLIKNSERHGMLYNVCMAVNCCPDNAIVLILNRDRPA